MEDIAGEDYMHAKRVSKYFEIKSLGDHHDLYLKSDTLILADAFEKSFTKKCLKIYHLDPATLFSVLELAWQAALKKLK